MKAILRSSILKLALNFALESIFEKQNDDPIVMAYVFLLLSYLALKASNKFETVSCQYMKKLTGIRCHTAHISILVRDSASTRPLVGIQIF